MSVVIGITHFGDNLQNQLLLSFGSIACIELFATVYFTSKLLFIFMNRKDSYSAWIIFIVRYFTNTNIRIQRVNFFFLVLLQETLLFCKINNLNHHKKQNFLPVYYNIDQQIVVNNLYL